MIDKNKQYRTRRGLPVRIYATDCGGEYPVHGGILKNGRWRLRAWTSEGFCTLGDEKPGDIIEVKPRIQRTGWLNVYQDAVFGVYKTREIADGYAMSHRIACIQIPIDCEEGEGL